MSQGPGKTGQAEPSGYASLIIKHVAQRIYSGKPFGLLEAHGPTGIGKTHAFISEGGVIEFLHANKIPVLFCCHRWSLLDEIEKKVKCNPRLRPVAVRSNIKQAAEACDAYLELTDNELDRLAQRLVKYSKHFSSMRPRDALIAVRDMLGNKVRKAVAEMRAKEHIMAEIGVDDEESYPKANDFMRFLTFNKGADLATDATTAIQELKEDSLYLRAFPACQWFLDPFSTVLIMSTHKFIKGFDVGPLNISAVSISDLKAMRPQYLDIKSVRRTAIIFDEFEAQEDAILKMLSDQPYIKNPIAAQSVFHTAAKAEWVYRGGSLQNEALNFLKRFPNAIPSHFIAGKGWDTEDKAYTFRSGNTLIASDDLSVEVQPRKMLVHKGSVSGEIKPIAEIFDSVEDRCRFWHDKTVMFAEAGNREALVFIGDNFNRLVGEEQTSHGSVFSNPNKIFFLYGAKNLNLIRPEEKMMNMEAHLSGYDFTGLIVKPAGGLFDDSDLDVRRYAMEITPEGLLVRLAIGRFVFGLSATSCLRRTRDHFEMGWVERYLSARDAMVVENKEEFDRRVGEIAARKTSGFSCSFKPILRMVHINTSNWGDFFSNGVDDPPKAVDYRKNRFLAIWDTVTQAAGNGHGYRDTTAWLAFTTSYRHAELALEASIGRSAYKDAAIAGDGLRRTLGMLVSPVHISESIKERRGKEQKPAYLLKFQEASMKPVLLFFLNAEAYKRAADFQSRLDWLKEQARRNEAELFVLTLYAASERGVNLVFSDGPEGFQEFNAVCLIDLPYYYLSDNPRHIRYNLRRLQKLMEKGVISRDKLDTFARMLLFGDEMPRIVKRVQGGHKRGYDYQVSAFAAAIQAAGRGVRNWRKDLTKTFYVAKELVADSMPDIVDDMRIVTSLPLLGPIAETLHGFLKANMADIDLKKREKQRTDESIEELLENFAIDCINNYRKGVPGYERVRKYWKKMRMSFLIGDIQCGIPRFCLQRGIKPNDKGMITNIDWAYEECNPSWEDSTDFGALVRSLQKVQANGKKATKIITGGMLKHNIRLEGTILPVEYEGKCYKPRSIVSQSIIKPGVSEYLVLEVLKKYGNAQYFCDDKRLFELFDIFLPDVNMAVDVKYWSFESIHEADGNGMPKLAENRLLTIQSVLGNGAKLAYVLLMDALEENRPAPYVRGLDDSIPFKDRISKGDIVVMRMLNPLNFGITEEFDTFCEWFRDKNAEGYLR